MELLRLPLVMLVSTPLWFSIRTVPEEDVCVHRIVLVMFTTCGGRVTLHTNKIASNGATSNTVIIVGFMSTTKTGSKKNKFYNQYSFTEYTDRITTTLYVLLCS